MGPQILTSEPNVILVVEDEILIALELLDLLEEAGYEVIGPAATVAAALKLLDDHAPCACILDVNLRGDVSAPVACALKAKNVPFVLSSAYGQETIKQHSAFDNAVNVGKPAPQSVLLSILASFSQKSPQ